MDKIIYHIQNDFSEYVSELKKLVNIPTISGNPEPIRKCSNILHSFLESKGWSVRIIEQSEGGAPYVYGERKSDQPDTPTILFYGHYDVQSELPIEAWSYPPFELTESDGRFYGRGTGDNKGQFLAHIAGIDAYLKAYENLPVNIKLLLDGEEEIGSPGMLKMIRENQELFDLDLVIVSDSSKHESGRPIVCFGNRGCMSLGLQIKTSEIDHHSGNKGGVIKNAAQELIKVLNDLVSKGGENIEGFFDNVVEMTEYELQLIEKLDFKAHVLKDTFKTHWILEDKVKYYENLFFKPCMTITGIQAGYMGSDIKTIIPSTSSARLDVRMVNSQKPEQVFQAIKNHILKINPHIILMELDQHIPPSKSDPQHPLCQKIIKAIKMAGVGKPIILPSIGSSLPNSIWTNDLNLPTISVPYANADQGNHGPNENLKISCFKEGMIMSASMIKIFEF